jgi:hypothetical protein
MRNKEEVTGQESEVSTGADGCRIVYRVKSRWDMLQLVAGRQPSICGQSRVAQGKSRATTATDGFRTVGSVTATRASRARLDKLKHVLPKSAETSLGAADMSVRATSGSEVRIKTTTPETPAAKSYGFRSFKPFRMEVRYAH